MHLPDERVTTQRRKQAKEGRKQAKEGRKEGRREPEGERESRKEGELGRKRERRNSYRERGRKCLTQYALKPTTVSSLEVIQESVSYCLLRRLLTTPGHTLRWGNLSAEMQLTYSTTSINWAVRFWHVFLAMTVDCLLFINKKEVDKKRDVDLEVRCCPFLY